jgi:tetratricopeptide (TPR) repeat protein
MISRHLFWITGVVLSCSVLASAQESAQLLEQKVLDRELAGGQTHTYRLPLTAGQFADVLAVQGGIDVVLVLFAPDGRKLGEVDSPNGSQGPEELWFLSEMAGDYKLEVRSLEKDADAGHYKIRLKEVRALTPDDPHFVAAQRVIAEGALLGSDHKEDQAIQKYQEATRLFRLMEDKKRRATAIKDLGWSYRRLAKNEEAIKLFMEARVLFEELGLKRDVAGMYMNAGLTSTGADAIAWYEKAIATLQPSVDKNLELTSRSAIGKTYYRLGDFAQAVKNFQQSLRLDPAVSNAARRAGARHSGPPAANPCHRFLVR